MLSTSFVRGRLWRQAILSRSSTIVSNCSCVREIGKCITHVVVHVGGAHQERAVVIRPLDVAGVGAVVLALCGIRHIPRLVVQQRGGNGPIPDFFSPGKVLVVVSVSGQSRSELEKSTVRHGILHQVSSLVDEDLPAQSTTT